ncbi:acyl-ACP thioesterase domain-containing protein [Peptoniphilus indolicus]|uniref:Acyl-ACP thioesterase n=2 Tax=Peptoniphilus indolicus TaxID=33030 RepID=A0A379DE08_9FIRM|nr:acyl-ACP thioesterase domain-containing protein [Peptoniphilus indolicus]SUB76218.1 Acyl-ACP thioesterase [Peptoniphilus indolicus]
MKKLNFKIDNIGTIDGVLKIEQLSKILLEVSNLESNVADKFMEENNLIWMIYSWTFKLSRNIKIGEDIKVATWVSNISKLRISREFVIEIEGNVIGECRAEFLIIELKSRKAIVAPKELLNYFEIYKKELFKSTRISRSDVNKLVSVSISGSDFDQNKHINNSVYIRWIEEAIYLEMKRHIKFLEIVYSKEINSNIKIDINCSETRDYFEIYGDDLHAKGNIILF